jgi:hypothetical protein
MGCGVVTGMAALPWVQRLAERARRTLAELELVDPLAPHAAPTTNGPIPMTAPPSSRALDCCGPGSPSWGQPDPPQPWPRGGGVHTASEEMTWSN